MNQIMRVGRGVLFAVEQSIRPEQIEHIGQLWRDVLPNIPMIVLSETRIVETPGDGPLMFEFTGSISPTMVAEFQRWWEGLTSSDTISGA